jgi:O-antigen ligase
MAASRTGAIYTPGAHGTHRRRALRANALRLAALLGAAALLAALWPLSAWALSPVAFPGLALLALGGVLIIHRPEYGIAMTMALSPFTNSVIGVTKPFHILLPLLSFGLLGYAMLRAPERPSERAGGVKTTLLIFVVVGVASSILALDPGESVTKLFILLSAAALLLATLRICTERRQLYVVAGGALAALILCGGQGVLEYLSGEHGQFGIVQNGVVVGRIQGSFGHPNQYAGFLAALIPLAVAMLFTRSAPRALRWMGTLGLAVGVPAIVWSYSRGALAAVVVGPILWLIVVRPRVAVLAAIMLAVLAYLFAPGVISQRFRSTSGGEVEIRSDIWAAALDIYTEHPILGAGVNNFSVAYARLPTVPAGATQRRLLQGEELLIPPHAQNLYLNVLAEEGLVGILAFFLFAGAAVRRAFVGSRSDDPLTRSICLGIGAGMAALAVHSFLDVGFYGEVAFPLFSMIAVATALTSTERESAAEPSLLEDAATQRLAMPAAG